MNPRHKIYMIPNEWCHRSLALLADLWNSGNSSLSHSLTFHRQTNARVQSLKYTPVCVFLLATWFLSIKDKPELRRLTEATRSQIIDDRQKEVKDDKTEGVWGMKKEELLSHCLLLVTTMIETIFFVTDPAPKAIILIIAVTSFERSLRSSCHDMFKGRRWQVFLPCTLIFLFVDTERVIWLQLPFLFCWKLWHLSSWKKVPRASTTFHLVKVFSECLSKSSARSLARKSSFYCHLHHLLPMKFVLMHNACYNIYKLSDETRSEASREFVKTKLRNCHLHGRKELVCRSLKALHTTRRQWVEKFLEWVLWRNRYPDYLFGLQNHPLYIGCINCTYNDSIQNLKTLPNSIPTRSKNKTDLHQLSCRVRARKPAIAAWRKPLRSKVKALESLIRRANLQSRGPRGVAQIWALAVPSNFRTIMITTSCYSDGLNL